MAANKVASRIGGGSFFHFRAKGWAHMSDRGFTPSEDSQPDPFLRLTKIDGG